MFRGLVPYMLAAVAAVAMWGWYFFVYVPPKLEYFEGLRFRMLAISAQQVKAKIDTLVSAVRTAEDKSHIDQGVHFEGVEKYLHFVVPELRHAAEVPDGLELGTDAQGAPAAHAIAWSEVMGPAVEAARGQFDDLVLTDKAGNALWQMQPTTPRVGNLGELLAAPPPADGWFSSLQWSLHSTTLKPSTAALPTTATSNVVDLDGMTTIVMTQPVKLSAPITVAGQSIDRLYLVGLVPQAAIKGESLHVPTEWIVLATVPFVLVFLALPFLKLATVTSKERYGTADVLALGVATTLAAAVAGALPFLTDVPSVDSDASLKTFASEIDRRLGQEAHEFLALAHTIEGLRDPLAFLLSRPDLACTVPIRGADQSAPETQVCNLWETLQLHAPDYYSDLDVVSWIGDDGMQRSKWTAKTQVTGLIRQDYQHFRDVRAGRLWKLLDDPAAGSFTIEPLRSPTTSEMAFVFAVPTFVKSEGGEPAAHVLALNIKPQSLVDPLVPRGYGFAIITPDGRVLFHSNSALSLEENFLKEVGNAGVASAALRAGTEASWTGDYHGRQHRLYATNLKAFTGCPWQVVTFREIDSLLGRMASRQSATIALYALDLIVLLLVVGLALLVVRLRGWSVVDTALTFSIQVRHPQAVAASIRALTGLAAAALTALALTYFVGRGWLRTLGIAFVVLPFVTVGLIVLSRWWYRRSASPYRPAQSGRETTEMFLTALLIGAIPAAGLARVVYREDALRYTVESLRENQDQLDAYVTRVRGGISQSSRYSETTKPLLLGPNGFAHEYALRHGEPLQPDEPLRPPSGSYLNVMDDTRAVPWDESAVEKMPESPLGELLTRVRNAPTSVSAPLAPVELNADHSRLRLAQHPDGFLSVAYDAAAPGAPWPMALLVSAAILAATFFVVLWAKWRLSTPDLPAARSISGLVHEIHLDDHGLPRTAATPAANPVVLLIGPPRTSKDEFARAAVIDTATVEPLRIPLLDQKLSEAWAAAQLARVEQAKRDTPGEDTVWVLLSNLEAQLVSKESRIAVFGLIEQLLDRHDGGRPLGLVITTTIDPLAHFNEVFFEERNAVAATAIPEVELNRMSLLLSRMRRCYTRLADSNPWPHWLPYEPGEWQTTLRAETAGHAVLRQIAGDIEHAWSGRIEVPIDELKRAVVERAQMFYQLLWTSCTRTEKLVLIQLAQEGLVNPKSHDTLQELLAKGLVRSGATPELFNFTFRDFLRRIERTDVVQAWERMDGSGLWVISSRLLASVLIVGGLFYLLTQGVSVQSVLPLISGSSFLGIPVVRSVASLFSSKKEGAATPS